MQQVQEHDGHQKKQKKQGKAWWKCVTTFAVEKVRLLVCSLPPCQASFMRGGAGAVLSLQTPTRLKQILTQNVALENSHLNKRSLTGPTQTPPPSNRIPYKRGLVPATCTAFHGERIRGESAGGGTSDTGGQEQRQQRRSCGVNNTGLSNIAIEDASKSAV